MSSPQEQSSQPELVGLVGIGLDGKDRHVRITRSKDFFLVGGSEETHDRMQTAVIKFGESLDDRGQSLEETSMAEAIDLLRKALEH